MEQPAATKIVRKFLLRELVNVTPSSVDKRIKFVALTPQGRAPVSYTHLTLPTNREV